MLLRPQIGHLDFPAKISLCILHSLNDSPPERIARSSMGDQIKIIDIFCLDLRNIERYPKSNEKQLMPPKTLYKFHRINLLFFKSND